MTDTEIINEVERLINSGLSITLPVRGNSMVPFIAGGRDSVILEKPRLPKRGDVVLARLDGGRYVLHRIIRVDGERVTLMGDGNITGVEECTATDIKARTTHVVGPDGKKRDLYTLWRRMASRLWSGLCPVRTQILAIYRRL